MPYKPFSLYNPTTGEFIEANTERDVLQLMADYPDLVEVDGGAKDYLGELRVLAKPIEVSEETFLINSQMVETVKLLRMEHLTLVIGEQIVGRVHAMFFHDKNRGKFFFAQDVVSKGSAELIEMFLLA